MKRTSLVNKKIIITGASSGIGEKVAWYVAKERGVPIILARSRDKLEHLKADILYSFHIDSPIYIVDLLNKQETKKVINEIIENHDPVHGLINNAGIGMFAELSAMNDRDIESMIQLNVTSLIGITKQLLPYFQKQSLAHIVNIASQAGKIATPKACVYAATKHAVLGFTNGLRLELTASSNIYVTAVNLGPVKTNFLHTADPTGRYEKNVARYMLDPDDVAKKIVQQLFIPKREINLPFWMEIGSRIYQLFPAICEKLFKRQFMKK